MPLRTCKGVTPVAVRWGHVPANFERENAPLFKIFGSFANIRRKGHTDTAVNEMLGSMEKNPAFSPFSSFLTLFLFFLFFPCVKKEERLS